MDSNLPNNDFNNTNPNNLNNNPVNVAPAVKRTSKAPLFASVLFGVLAVAGVGFGVFEYLENNKNNSEIKDLKAEIANLKGFNCDVTDEPTIKPTDQLTDEGGLGGTGFVDFNMMDEEVRDVIDEFEAFFVDRTGKDPDTYEYEFVHFRNSELKANTFLDKAYNFRYHDLGLGFEESEQFNSDVVNKLSALGFEQREDLQYMQAATFEKPNGIICTYDNGLACGYKGWIKDETIAFVNELAEAYKNSEGKYPTFLNTQGYEIENSDVEPFQKVTVALDGAAGLFYRESEDAEWKFFKGTQAQLECSDYNTPELKKAFAGDSCYDTTTQDANAIVKP